jgi:GT2 family glycosyltransferase
MSLPQKGLCSIVIPTRNEGDMLHQTVDSITGRTAYPSIEVIVIDDGSTDGSCDRYRGADGPVRVITSQNLGIARARNLGARYAAGQYLVFIDAHCKVSSDWISLFIDALAPPDVGLVGPCFTKLEEPEPRGCGMTWTDYTLETTWFEPCEIDRPYEVPLTAGGCQAFRTSTFRRIGRYDDSFTAWGFEDTEICVRAWLLGYRVLVDPRITVAHHFRDSRDFEVVDRDIVYNFLRMIHLHFSDARIQRVVQAISPNPWLSEAFDALERSDVLEIRAEMEASRVRNDDWFFDVLVPEVR